MTTKKHDPMSGRNHVTLSNHRIRRHIPGNMTIAVATCTSDNGGSTLSGTDSCELAEKRADRIETPLQRWRRIARLVRIFCAVCIALRKYAMDAGLMDNYLVAVTTRTTKADSVDGELEELTFSLRDFQIKKELNVPKSLIAVMEKTHDKRTDAEVRTISRLMKSLSGFKKYTETMQLLMSRIVRYQKCEKRRVVLRKGHIGYSVYFIYSGSVTVTLDIDDGNVYLEGVNVSLKKGACFGEIALVRDTRRNATIVCAEDCEFLIVDKDDFVANGLHIQTGEEFTTRREFFRYWPPFKALTEDEINSLTYISRTEDFSHNKVITKNSRENDWLWFVIKGSCEVLRLVDLRVSPNYNRIVSLQDTANVTYPINARRNRVKSAPNRVRSRPVSSPISTMTSRPKTSLGLIREMKHSPGDVTNGGSVITNLGTSRLQPSDNNAGVKVGFSDSDSHHIDSGDSDNGAMVLGRGRRDQPINSRIYVRVDVLRDGQGFGLEGMLDGYKPNNYPQYSMVSKGCTIIHISRNKLKEMIDADTIERIAPLVKTYPLDLELCDRFLFKSEWDHYKHELVEEVVTDHQNNVMYNNSVRNCQQPDYNARFETDYMTSQFYTPMSSRTCSSAIGSYSVSRDDIMKMSSRRLRSAIGGRRLKTAPPKSTIIDTDPVLVKEAERYGRTAGRASICSPVGKHKVWAEKLKNYTGQKSRSSSARPRLAVSPETRIQDPLTATEPTRRVTPILARPASANQKTERGNTRKKRAGNHVVIVSTKPISLGAKKDHGPFVGQASKS